ncbi:MAG: hypothetical protein CL685_00725 [Candidatus Magasanikbacteria bacterium]|nr:hypothetical protein [Candidatus Magasanikbacteria bacterium]
MPAKKRSKKEALESESPKKVAKKKTASSVSKKRRKTVDAKKKKPSRVSVVKSTGKKKRVAKKTTAKKGVVKKTKTTRRSVSKEDHKDMRAAVEAIPSLIFEEVLFDTSAQEVLADSKKQKIFLSDTIVEDRKRKHRILVVGVTFLSTLIFLVWGFGLRLQIGNISAQEHFFDKEVEGSLSEGYSELSSAISAIREQKDAAVGLLEKVEEGNQNTDSFTEKDVAVFDEAALASVLEKIQHNTEDSATSSERVEVGDSL